MFFKIIVLCFILKIVNSISQHPILIVVSYDAFGNNFFHPNVNPHMIALQTEGTYTSHMKNVFPTKTFPNHHSIATGLYPDKHGVIANSFYDPATESVVKFSYELFHYNESIVPIWRLNEREGNGRHSGSMMWPGAAFAYQKEYPTYIQKYEPSLNWYGRVDMVISWLTNRKKPANLVMMYFDEPDVHGHAFGPNSSIVADKIKKLDNIAYYLEQQIAVKGLKDFVNVIHLSDHGLVAVTPDRFINISHIILPGTYKVAGKSPCLQIIPNQGYEDQIYTSLKNYSLTNKNFKVFKKNEYPSRWNYKNNPRTPPILLLADKGYAFQDMYQDAHQYSKKYKFKVTNTSEFGVHGYDNEIREMNAFFMARGPYFKANNRVPPFNSVDLFNLFCDILNIKPTDNDGSFVNIIDMHVDSDEGLWSLISVVATATVLVFSLILTISVITVVVIKRQQNITTNAALKKRFPQSHTTIEAQHLLEPEDT